MFTEHWSHLQVREMEMYLTTTDNIIRSRGNCVSVSSLDLSKRHFGGVIVLRYMTCEVV